MCFSPIASFTAGTALTVIGGVTVQKAWRKPAMLFAAIPLLFGVQQLTEGVIWLTLGNPAILSVATFIYVLFSHVLWPIVVPLAAFLMEPVRWRRASLIFFVAIGAVVGFYFLYYLFLEKVEVQTVLGNIKYVAPHFSVTFVLSPYTVATCVSCLLSSHRLVNMFGILTFLSAVVAYRFYDQAFVSVWCFFAAILSAIVYLQFRSLRLETRERG